MIAPGILWSRPRWTGDDSGFMELYQLRQDEAFRQAFNEVILRILRLEEKGAA